MGENYFEYTRKEITPLLPSSFEKVLEIGCASGATLRWLKDEYPCTWVGGVELNEQAAEFARPHLDYLVQANIEQESLDIEPGSVDLLLCLDVLEHLIDPWSAVTRLRRYVKPGGHIIVSIPNVRHKSVLLPLLFSSKWSYADEGILDRTHLRFFVRSTALELLKHGGFVPESVLGTGLGRSKKSQMANALIPEVIKGLFIKQYLIRARNPQ